MVGTAGFEPTTPCTPCKCASQAALHPDRGWSIRNRTDTARPARRAARFSRRSAAGARALRLHEHLELVHEVIATRLRGLLEEVRLHPRTERRVERALRRHAVAELLEREGRGLTLFRRKWKLAMAQWDGKVAEQAKILREPQGGRQERHDENFNDPEPAAPILTISDLSQDPNLYNFMKAKAVMNMQDPNYLVDKVIPSESFGFVVGVPGCLKSFIALNLALSCAAGVNKWMGHDIKRNGPVVYITSEGLGDIKNRIKAWEKHTGLDLEDAPFYLIPDSMNFMQKIDVQKLVRTIKIGRAHV